MLTDTVNIMSTIDPNTLKVAMILAALIICPSVVVWLLGMLCVQVIKVFNAKHGWTEHDCPDHGRKQFYNAIYCDEGEYVCTKCGKTWSKVWNKEQS